MSGGRPTRKLRGAVLSGTAVLAALLGVGTALSRSPATLVGRASPTLHSGLSNALPRSEALAATNARARAALVVPATIAAAHPEPKLDASELHTPLASVQKHVSQAPPFEHKNSRSRLAIRTAQNSRITIADDGSSERPGVDLPESLLDSRK
jgi:hypothetical protein